MGVENQSAIFNKPVLSKEDFMQMSSELETIAAKLPLNPKQSEAMRQGEQSSRFMGAGMEYEESRPYEMGDEIRRINWRLMARTGQAYTKLFQEERQENWFILVDHRSSMRFGTRTRLKAAQASRVAGYYAWLGQQAGIPVAVGRLAESFNQSPIFEGRSTFSQVMQAVSQPCPPISSRQPEVQMNDVLLSLSHQLQPGSRLILISDFHDIDDRTKELLTAMQAFLLVKSVLIKDASEMQIPNIAGLQLQSVVDGKHYLIDTKNQREGFQHWSENYFSSIGSVLQAANVGFYEMTTELDLQQINRVLSVDPARMPAHGGGQYG